VPVPVPVPVPVSVPVPVFIPGVFLPCGYDTPCPTDGNYYYCTAPGTHNDATNGCEPVIMGPFPATACGAQCMTDPMADTMLPCTSATPCNPTVPSYYCTAPGTHNDATGGCKAKTTGPFAPEACGTQCKTDV
jgi:hypothetical protein